MSIRSNDLERVRELPLFAMIEERVFDRLTAGAMLQRFPAGADLIAEGEPADFLYILLDGAVERSGTWNDTETTLAVLGPVSTFILAAVILHAPATMNARTIGWSDILMIPGAALRRGLEEDVRFAGAVALELSGCYQGVVRAIKNQKLRGGSERLANYLLAQQSRQGGEPTLTLPYEKRVVASLLGMSPENLSRAFANLSDYGVSVDGPMVTISRPPLLERLAKPDPLIDKHLPADITLISKADRERNCDLGRDRQPES